MIRYLLNEIKDKLDSTVSLVIVVDDVTKLRILRDVVSSVNIDRESYIITVTDRDYIMELRIAYNTYLTFMDKLHEKGYNLKNMTRLGLVNTLIRLED